MLTAEGALTHLVERVVVPAALSTEGRRTSDQARRVLAGIGAAAGGEKSVSYLDLTSTNPNPSSDALVEPLLQV